ncbi:MAG TPA: OmpW family outer membrane protein [Steroidobacteraceae bacterium]|nr:OmpW family outer membrane protein [Steroidobacteraceae bacterium]
MMIRLAIATILATTGLAQSAFAQDAGDWIARAGFHSIQPKSSNHPLVDVEQSTGLSFSATYMATAHWGVELLAALPFLHEIRLNGADAVGETALLPPTLSAQYHFSPGGRVRPYAGAGLNYTIFSAERTWGALHGTKLELDSSFGAAAQVGVDIDVLPGWFLNVDARWFDIDTDARLDGVDFGTIAIDPYAFGVSLSRRF